LRRKTKKGTANALGELFREQLARYLAIPFANLPKASSTVPTNRRRDKGFILPFPYNKINYYRLTRWEKRKSDRCALETPTPVKSRGGGVLLGGRTKDTSPIALLHVGEKVGTISSVDLILFYTTKRSCKSGKRKRW
jgi:hypothetical protein